MRPQASNPARIRIHYVRFLLCNPATLIFILGPIVLSFLLFYSHADLKLQLLPAIGLAVGLISLHEARNLFMSGDLCPAMIIDRKRGLVAAYTDLSTGRTPCPAIDVFSCHFGFLPGGPYEDGDRLPLAAFYKGNPHAPHWLNFGGYFIQAGTPNEKLWKRALASIDQQQWDMLAAGIAALPQPYRQRLYLDLKFKAGQTPSFTPNRTRNKPSNLDSAPQETSDVIHVRCPHCHKAFKSHNPDIIGRRHSCPKCKKSFIAKPYKPSANDPLFETEGNSHSSSVWKWTAIAALASFFFCCLPLALFLDSLATPSLPNNNPAFNQPFGRPPGPGNPAFPNGLRGRPPGPPPFGGMHHPMLGNHLILQCPITLPIPADYQRLPPGLNASKGSKLKICRDGEWKSATVVQDLGLRQILLDLADGSQDPLVAIDRRNLIIDQKTFEECVARAQENALLLQRFKPEDRQKNTPPPAQKLPDSPDAPVKLVLKESGPRPDEVAALVVEITDLSLDEAGEFIKDLPLVLLQSLPKWEAEKWGQQFEKAGGTAVIENITPDPPK